MTIRVQLVNEQSLIREGLLCLLHADLEIETLPAIECGNDCSQACVQSECDLIVICPHENGGSSLDCVRQIVSRFTAARILLIISKEHSSVTHEAIRLGAKGVVSTDVPSALLKRAIHLIAEGGMFIEPWLARTLAEAPYNHSGSPFDSLSLREHSVLKMMLNGCSCTAIASRLHISEKTVANHHTHIMKKLAVKNMVELMRLALRHNLISAE